MNGQSFMRLVNEAFVPFLNQLGLRLDEPSVSGRAYHVSFTGRAHVIVVSFEPGDQVLLVLVQSREGSKLSDIDDRIQTPRLSDLNARHMPGISREERLANEVFFESVEVHDKPERDLLKAAKELRLVLPRHLHG